MSCLCQCVVRVLLGSVLSLVASSLDGGIAVRIECGGNYLGAVEQWLERVQTHF